MSNRISFVVGNGQRVSFWKDNWCGDTPLCASFPSLFALADEVTLQSFRAGLFSFISNEEHLEIMCAAKSKLLRLGGILGQSSNFGPS